MRTGTDAVSGRHDCVARGGKRGGIRVIYYLRSRQDEIWMLTLYATNEQASIPLPILKKIKEEDDGSV